MLEKEKGKYMKLVGIDRQRTMLGVRNNNYNNGGGDDLKTTKETAQNSKEK